MENITEKLSKPLINPWFIACIVILPTAMEVLDSSIANVVLPYIAGDLGVSVDKSSWVLTCYLVSNAVILPITGWLSDAIGRKRYFLISIATFTIASLMCGLSTSLGELLFFRVLQGLGGGGLLPISQAILIESFPEEKRSIAMGIYGMGVILAPILGPVLGGWIADNFAWNWIFLINIPIGFISIALVYMFIREPKTETHKKYKKIDYIGLSTLTIGISALQLLLDKGQRYDWFSSEFIIVMAIISVISILFCIYWELKCENPIIDLRLLKDRNLSIGIISMFVIGMVFYAVNEALPVFLQTQMGYTAFLSGLVIGISGIVVLFGMPIAGVLSSKFNQKWLIMIGWTFAIISLYKMTCFNLNITFMDTAWVRSIMGLGTSLIFVPVNSIAFEFIPHEKIEYGTGMINLARNIGGSVGISAINTILARSEQIHQNIFVKHISPLNPVFSQTISTMKENLGLTLQQSYHVVYSMLQKQSAMLSYINCFHTLMLILIFTIPMFFFLKKGNNTLTTSYI
ncbi:MAG TPA: DHA2 family efflux MFS transporter permease subunit [Victivallales bacterium]|nr:DHA2 family efflux MFS transporter permease subunit [Victivallales bacterium]